MLFNKLNKPIIEFIGKVKHTFWEIFVRIWGKMLLFAIGKRPLFTFCNWKTACKSLEAVILGEQKSMLYKKLTQWKTKSNLVGQIFEKYVNSFRLCMCGIHFIATNRTVLSAFCGQRASIFV